MRLIDVLLPVRCARCGEPPFSPCAHCLAALDEAPILPVPNGLDSLTALTAYNDRSALFITEAKYRNSRAALGVLMRWAVELTPAAVSLADAVTWAPTTDARRRERGFDQAQILARHAARRLGRPLRSLLRRQPGPTQTGRSRADRLTGPSFRSAGSPCAVVLVDDVCTTGATLTAAATALRHAGAGTIHGLVLARTPQR